MTAQKRSCWLYVRQSLSKKLTWTIFSIKPGVSHHILMVFTSIRNHQWCWANTMIRPFHGFRLKFMRPKQCSSFHQPLLQGWDSRRLWTKAPPAHGPVHAGQTGQNKKLYETGKICVLSLKHSAIGHKLLDTHVLANQKDRGVSSHFPKLWML